MRARAPSTSLRAGPRHRSTRSSLARSKALAHDIEIAVQLHRRAQKRPARLVRVVVAEIAKANQVMELRGLDRLSLCDGILRPVQIHPPQVAPLRGQRDRGLLGLGADSHSAFGVNLRN